MAQQYFYEMSSRMPAYQQGEDKTAYYERAFQAVTKPVDPEKLNNPDTKFLESYVIPENERAQRRQASERIRRKLIEMRGFKEGRPDINLNHKMGRAHAVACYYFAQKGQPEMIDRYEQLFSNPVLLADRIEELKKQGIAENRAQEQAAREQKELLYARGHFLAEIMEPLQHYTPEVLVNMTPEEAEEHMTDIIFLYFIGMNVEPFMKPGAESDNSDVVFTAEDFEKIKFLLNSYNSASIPALGLFAKGNPYYELYDTDRIKQELSMEELPDFMQMQKGESDLENLANDLMSVIQTKYVSVVDMVKERLNEVGIDVKKPYIAFKPDGTEVDLGGNLTDHLDYLQDGGSFIVQQGENIINVAIGNVNGKIKVVDTLSEDIPVRREKPKAQRKASREEARKEQPEVSEEQEHEEAHKEQPEVRETMRANTNQKIFKKLFDADYRQKQNEIDAAMKNADPWYIRSSSNFREMKACYKELKALGDHLSEDPAVQAQQKKKLDDLQKAAAKYLSVKGTEGKNDLEKNRIALAQQIKDMATSKYTALDRMDKEAKAHAAEPQKANEPKPEDIKAKEPETEKQPNPEDILSRIKEQVKDIPKDLTVQELTTAVIQSMVTENLKEQQESEQAVKDLMENLAGNLNNSMMGEQAQALLKESITTIRNNGGRTDENHLRAFNDFVLDTQNKTAYKIGGRLLNVLGEEGLKARTGCRNVPTISRGLMVEGKILAEADEAREKMRSSGKTKKLDTETVKKLVAETTVIEGHFKTCRKELVRGHRYNYMLMGIANAPKKFCENVYNKMEMGEKTFKDMDSLQKDLEENRNAIGEEVVSYSRKANQAWYEKQHPEAEQVKQNEAPKKKAMDLAK